MKGLTLARAAGFALLAAATAMPAFAQAKTLTISW